MAEIKAKILKDRNLTIFEVAGKVTANEITDSIKDYYESEFTLNILWDLSKSDLSELTGDQVRGIVSIAKSYAHLREGGKTALITNIPLSFGLARMYESLAEANQHPVPNRVFRSLDEAMEWLESDQVHS